jgi:hypothetical protein
MKLIGKGEEAFNGVMEEIEAMFEMDVVQRDCVEQAVFKMTEPDTREYTYQELYDTALSDLRIFGQPMTLVDYTDGEGNPEGGWMEACGLQIRWQRGALDFEDDVPWNGLFLVTLLEAAQRRLEYYQSTKFECEDNAEALQHITDAINVLNSRQIRRFCEGSRGKHEEDE